MYSESLGNIKLPLSAFIMPRRRDAGYQSLTSKVVFKALDLVTGHGRPLDPRPPQPRYRRYNSVLGDAQAQTDTRSSSNWPGVEAPLDFDRLPPRSHCVTPPPSDNGAGPSKPNDQAQSPLFKLPPDLLLMIYEEVLGSQVIHIVRRNKTLAHAICKVNKPPCQEDCKEGQCRGLKLPTGVYAESGQSTLDLLPLLQTCRKVYTDAIEVLYGSNIFDFDSMESLISFSVAVIPKRFDAIRYLQLDFRFSTSSYFSESTAYNDPPRWERAWRVIGSMNSLQELWVWMSWHRLEFSPVEEARLIEQLDQVRQLKIFEVSLPALRGKEVKRKYEQLFHVVRRG